MGFPWDFLWDFPGNSPIRVIIRDLTGKKCAITSNNWETLAPSQLENGGALGATRCEMSSKVGSYYRCGTAQLQMMWPRSECPLREFTERRNMRDMSTRSAKTKFKGNSKGRLRVFGGGWYPLVN